jgi:hypothetical protein
MKEVTSTLKIKAARFSETFGTTYYIIQKLKKQISMELNMNFISLETVSSSCFSPSYSTGFQYYGCANF